jgi:two-component system, OmpR family, response regulator
MPKARVLVVEDDPDLLHAVAAALRRAGHEVRAISDGRDPAALDSFSPDLAVLDIGLPGPDGLALARNLRARTDVPVVFLTARDSVADRLAGFDAGADDYVLKPFVLAELMARVAAVLRRTGRLHSTMAVEDLVVDENACTAVRAGHRLDLTATEWRLLLHLAHHRGRTLSKTQLLTQVWGYDDYDPNLVEVHVSALRRKTEVYGTRLIHTTRGLGYTLREGR